MPSRQSTQTRQALQILRTLKALRPARCRWLEKPVPAPQLPRLSAEPADKQRFARRKFQSLSTFVVGPDNCVAHKSAQMCAAEPGKISPLFLHGPTGVGKTHLLEGIWTAFKKSHRHETAVYLSAEQFTSYFLEALHGSGLPVFRRKYRGVGLLIIDDVQFFIGKKATLLELQHTIDTVLRSGAAGAGGGSFAGSAEVARP